MTIIDSAPNARVLPGLDRLGVMIVLIGAGGALLPFSTFRANRIVLGEGRGLLEALDPLAGWLLVATIVAGLGVALVRLAPTVKLVTAFLVLGAIALLIGRSGAFLTPDGDSFARVSPGSGFWLLLFAFALMAADALTRLRLGPWPRIAILGVVTAGIAALLWSGAWNELSILKEYSNRAAAFRAEARTHLVLAFGAVAAATLAGVPIGILCHRVRPLRGVVLSSLNIVQTIPSMALFGLLIAPMAWIAANVPGASAVGVSGIGMAPALVALFAYSLLPIVANTVVGLQSVPEAANEAARGMGMTSAQRLTGIELPLAFPVVLAGIRIVLVQNIGLATIAALIGGGGFGVFVFQGIGQTAMDLVLLGALPTVALAFGAAVILDAAIEMASLPGEQR